MSKQEKETAERSALLSKVSAMKEVRQRLSALSLGVLRVEPAQHRLN